MATSSDTFQHLDNSFTRLRTLQDSLKSRREAADADPENPELRRRYHDLEAEWDSAFSEYAMRFDEWREDFRGSPESPSSP